MEQKTDCIFLNCRNHLIEHIKASHLVLNKRISLTVCLKSDTLTQLIHIIDMIHPLTVNHLKKNDTFQFTELLDLRELRLLCLVEKYCLLLQMLLKFLHILHIRDTLLCDRLKRNDWKNQFVEFI